MTFLEQGWVEEKVILGTWDNGSDCEDTCYTSKTYYVSGMVLNTDGQYLT